MALKDYKKNRQAAVQHIAESFKNDKTSYDKDTDARFWTPQVSKDGKATATIRFLPNSETAKENADVPWVRYYSHGFQGPTGKWYIENSLSSLGQVDPVGEYNSRIWNIGTEEAQKDARKRSRREQYVSNILVVDDPANPSNNGKVFLYRYNKTIYGKIKERMIPESAKAKPVLVFDLFEGADFQLIIKNVGGFRNYDSSYFDGVSAIWDGDERAMEKTYSELYDLSEFVSLDKFDTYEALKAKFLKVMGITEKEFNNPTLDNGRNESRKTRSNDEEDDVRPTRTSRSNRRVEEEEDEEIDESDESDDDIDDDDDDSFIDEITKAVTK